MTTLLVAEHDKTGLKDVTAKALTAAQGARPAGRSCWSPAKAPPAAAEAAAKLDGVAKVLVADGELYAHRLAEPTAALIVALAPAYDAIVAPSTAAWKNVMPRVAALLDVMQVSDVIKVVSADTFERPIYAGNAIQTVQSTDAKKVVTVRTASFQATGEGRRARRSSRSAAAADPGLSTLQGRGAGDLRPAGAGLGQDHHLGRPGDAEPRELHDLYRAGRRQARRRDGRLARRGRCRLRAERLAGRADRQGRRAGPLHRRRHFRAPSSISPA